MRIIQKHLSRLTLSRKECQIGRKTNAQRALSPISAYPLSPRFTMPPRGARRGSDPLLYKIRASDWGWVAISCHKGLERVRSCPKSTLLRACVLNPQKIQIPHTFLAEFRPNCMLDFQESLIRLHLSRKECQTP